MKHEIDVTIEPGGKIIAEVNGVEGNICEILSAWIDNLGEVTEHRRKKEIGKIAPKIINKVGK